MYRMTLTSLIQALIQANIDFLFTSKSKPNPKLFKFSYEWPLKMIVFSSYLLKLKWSMFEKWYMFQNKWLGWWKNVSEGNAYSQEYCCSSMLIYPGLISYQRLGILLRLFHKSVKTSCRTTIKYQILKIQWFSIIAKSLFKTCVSFGNYSVVSNL